MRKNIKKGLQVIADIMGDTVKTISSSRVGCSETMRAVLLKHEVDTEYEYMPEKTLFDLTLIEPFLGPFTQDYIYLHRIKPAISDTTFHYIAKRIATDSFTTRQLQVLLKKEFYKLNSTERDILSQTRKKIKKAANLFIEFNNNLQKMRHFNPSFNLKMRDVQMKSDNEILTAIREQYDKKKTKLQELLNLENISLEYETDHLTPVQIRGIIKNEYLELDEKEKQVHTRLWEKMNNAASILSLCSDTTYEDLFKPVTPENFYHVLSIAIKYIPDVASRNRNNEYLLVSGFLDLINNQDISWSSSNEDDV